jgi:hypothetical protein
LFEVVEVPPFTEDEERKTALREGGSTVKLAVRVAPLYEADMVTTRLAVTGLVVITKLVLVAPAGTVTEAGTEVLGSLVESVTTVPPEGAGPFKVTVFIPVI